MMAIFTSKVCIEQRLPMTIILPSSAESFFKETVESGGWLVRFSLIMDFLLCWYPAEVASYITNIPFTITVSESRIFSEFGYVSMF